MTHPILSVAPMMGCTDRHFRYLLRLISPKALLYSEMITTGALLYNAPEAFLQHAQDEPVALQLGGSDPKALAACAVLAESFGYQEVNLNCGCPSDRVQTGGIGACLMATPEVVADCYRAMQAVTALPITIKCRIGIDDHDSYDDFLGFIEPNYEAGCRLFVVHARAAILKGLSPKDNREIPPLKYDYVTRIQKDFPEAVFVLNGGLKTVEDVLAARAQVPSLMLGRAIYNDPWLLHRLDVALDQAHAIDPAAIIDQFRDYMQVQLAQGVRLKHMTRHLLGLYLGQPGARSYRRYLSEHMFEDDAGIEVFDRAITHRQTPNRTARYDE
ncbi:tRNA dihydrouridine(20/20a) synthase DusA [Pseudomonadales bacterium]|nr:tRNA dihydrouridine(20/20a) synthase DusA [Pseudomonadales bacterium]